MLVRSVEALDLSRLRSSSPPSCVVRSSARRVRLSLGAPSNNPRWEGSSKSRSSRESGTASRAVYYPDGGREEKERGGETAVRRWLGHRCVLCFFSFLPFVGLGSLT